MDLLYRLRDCMRCRKGASGEINGFRDSWDLFFDLQTLQLATDSFSDSNRLGHGGFGPVYKGVLGNGDQVAIKKLSLTSRQGIREFTNEVKSLLKIQHKNLVMLLGCCVQGPEKMLVYEYLPNRSLDYILFDKQKSPSLRWPQRFQIIVGVIRGLLYLHEEAPVRIIHRDVKASNILLDHKFNPKISDFGLARLFPGDDTHLRTFKISGTHGYMAPEYAMHGYLSVKADVFSFGILVLEIVSGRKVSDGQLGADKSDLLTYTWNLFQSGRQLELVDETLETIDASEALMCIQLGLLCCQAIVSDRPDMNTLHMMISNDSFTLPKPGMPGLQGRGGRWNTTTNSSTSLTNTKAPTTTYDTKQSVASTVEDFSRNSISYSSINEGK
ncbi:cysteine-rich receptor-like protein kinase 10 [Bidens hawaiensis]|uniref:cysteine-rich receptor-like protein kinase 10 n=1 Tax=Bidens hawaiensis TaxID=980011 RepID=UPI004048F4E0